MGTISDKEFIFIVGAPRSGTTWLNQMVQAHPATVGLREELTVFTYLHLLEKRFQEEKLRIDQGHWRQGAPLLFTEDEFYAGLRKLAEVTYARVLERNPEATHIMDKHPGYALHLPLIDRLFPRARILHIIRDGREVAVSMISAKERRGFGEGEIHGAAREWATNVRRARAYGSVLGKERYLEVRYEDLVKDPATHLKKIFHFTSLPISDESIAHIASENALSKKQVSSGDKSLNELRMVPNAIWQNKLSLQQRWTMDQMVGDLLEELCYGKSGWWAVEKGDQVRMRLYPFKQKLLSTIRTTLHTWRTPLVKRLKG